MKLTDAQVRNLKPREQRYEVWEDGGRGFGLRVTPRGTKSFIFLYRFKGKNRRLTLGTYPAMTLAKAHKCHAEAWERLQKGIDPGAEVVAERREERKAPTVADLVTEYIEKWAKSRKRSWKVDKRILEKDVLPVWGKHKAKEISRRDVINLLDSVLERGAPIMANRTLAVIRKMFNFALSRDIVPSSPCQAIQSPSPENRRDRVLTNGEILAFWHGIDRSSMSKGIKLALKLQLATVQRKGEVISAAWDEIDLVEGWWTIPADKAKNRFPHRVPLSPVAVELLLEASNLAVDSPWVFPSPRRDKHITPAAVDHALRHPGLEGLGFTFVPHDLRRTAASHMTSMGVSRLVVSKILNHVERGVTAVYDRHSYDLEKRQALEAWGNRLKSVVGGEDDRDKVLSFIRPEKI